MATTLALLLELPFCFCCCFTDNLEDSDTSSSLTPLLERLDRTPPPSPAMPPRKTYGARGTTVARRAAAALLGGGGKVASARSPLADVTDAITNLSLQEEETAVESGGEEVLEPETPAADESVLPTPNSLLGLCEAYKTDTNKKLCVWDWNDIIADNDNLIKIAEASYAEVYRVTNSEGTSILKIMRVKLPEVPESLQIPTAVDVTDLMGEIRIMNALTEHPGFVKFKCAHLVQGQTPRCLITAWHDHQYGMKQNGEDTVEDDGEQSGIQHDERDDEDEPPYFPDPKTYSEEDIFLIIELGDAGDPLDEYEITTSEEFYDVFIGTTIALARAEATNEFEHRDLHENNICIKVKPEYLKHDPNRVMQCISGLQGHKYGYSGLEITIIDYGLSRAKLANGEVMFKDLEQDLDIFKGVGSGMAGKQYDTYRRMRTYLLEGTHTSHPLTWHTPSSFHTSLLSRSWSTHIPYTNILWLRYLFSFLHDRLKSSLSKFPDSYGTGIRKKKFEDFEKDVRELKRRLDPRTKKENGAFESAVGVSEWLLKGSVGWVNAEQVVDGEGESFLQ